MHIQNLTHDSQTQAGTTGITRTTGIDAIETFGQTRQMSRRDPRTVVPNPKVPPGRRLASS